MENMKRIEVLEDNQLQAVDGGNPAIALAVAGLCVALFKVGYDIGRDMAKNGW